MPELFDNYSHCCKFSAHCLFAKYFDRCDHLSKEDPFQISRTQAAAYGLEKASDFSMSTTSPEKLAHVATSFVNRAQ